VRVESLTVTEAAALGLLAMFGPRSGYDLSASVNRSVGFVWAPARSQIYTVLKRLERRGLIAGEAVPQHGRPDKVVFSATETGHAAVVAWLEEDTMIAPEERDVLVLKVFFAELAAPAALLAQLDRFGEAVAQRLAVYEAIERELLAEPETPGQLAAVRLGIALMRATRTWARRTRATLTATPAP
jgi:DNA-binding PadR family transcriptional regulator